MGTRVRANGTVLAEAYREGYVVCPRAEEEWMRDKRWIVWALAIAAAAGVVYLVTKPAGPSSGDVSGEQFAQLAEGGVRIIDVRTPIEYEGGHIPGAELVPVDQLQAAAASWDPAEPIALYCLSDDRSTNAMQYLRAQGFKTVYNLTGGIGSWPGALVTGSETGEQLGAIPTNGKPRMIEFSSGT